MVITRDVPFVAVINPPVLGARRRKRLEAHLPTCRGRIPSVKYMGVNKNHLDIRGWNSPLLRDERGFFIRSKLALGLEPHVKDFKKEYGHYFRVGPRDVPMEKASAGTVAMIACAISHIQVWEYVARELEDDQAALILEDDVFLSRDQSFDTVRMPAEADILYQSHRVTPGEAYDEEFFRVKASASGAYTYFLTAKGANKLCAALLPAPDCRDIDMEMFREWALDRDLYKVFAAPKMNVRHAMGGRSLIKEEPVRRCRLGKKLWQYMLLSLRGIKNKVLE